MKYPPSVAWRKLRELLNTNVAPEHRDAYLAFHDKVAEQACDMPASIKFHHAYVGGYATHIYEVTFNGLMISNILRPTFTAEVSKAMSASDVVIAAYVHDLDKLFWRYRRGGEPPTQPQLKLANTKGIPISAHETKQTISDKIAAVMNGHPIPSDDELSWHERIPNIPAIDDSASVLFLCNEHGLTGITRGILHAITLHHGGWAPLPASGEKVAMSPLATVLHSADILSANAQNGNIDPKPESSHV